MNVVAVSGRVLIKLRVMFEFILIKNFKRIVRVNQKVYVEVYETEDAGFERRRGVDVAVELEESARRLLKTKNAVPAIRPEELCAQRPGLYGADEWVSNLLREKGVEDDERILKPCDARGPTAADPPVVFAGVDDNLRGGGGPFLRRRLEHHVENSLGSGAGGAGCVSEYADALDFDLAHVFVEERADPRGRAGRDQVSGFERHRV